MAVNIDKLKKDVKAIDFPFDYGTVKIQVRQGKPVLVTIEETLKLD